MFGSSWLFCRCRLAFSVVALSSEHHHEDAHKRTGEEREEWKDCIGIHFPCGDEDSDETGNTEENEQCFA